MHLTIFILYAEVGKTVVYLQLRAKTFSLLSDSGSVEGFEKTAATRGLQCKYPEPTKLRNAEQGLSQDTRDCKRKKCVCYLTLGS